MTVTAKLFFTLWLAGGLQAQEHAGTPVLQPTTFGPAPAGCAMAHCDVRMSDNVRLTPPLSPNPAVIAHDSIPTGSGNPFAPRLSPNQGLGCASNGQVAVCSYNNTFGDNVVAYLPDGTRVWSSGSLLDNLSLASVPMISSDSSVVAADDKSVIRFAATGAVLWNTPTPGGIPISPVVTQSGAVVLATRGGPISAFDSVSGNLIGSIYVRQNPGDASFFDTTNTPCVVNNRVYVSMALPNDPNYTARLVALDLNTSNPTQPFTVAWYFVFGGPSYASPTCIGNTIYFDGGRVSPGGPQSPQLFAVRDDGTVGTLVWVQPAPTKVAASFSRDPRGGVWVEYLGYGSLQRRSTPTGVLLESLNITNLVGGTDPNFPFSALTMAGTATRPILVVGTTSRSGLSSYVIAIDLNARALLWKVNINPTFGSDDAPVQFPIALNSAGKPVLVFSGRASGAYFVADP